MSINGGKQGRMIAVQLFERGHAEIAAQPDEGFRFVGWASNGPTGDIISTTASYTIDDYERNSSTILVNLIVL